MDMEMWRAKMRISVSACVGLRGKKEKEANIKCFIKHFSKIKAIDKNVIR